MRSLLEPLHAPLLVLGRTRDTTPPTPPPPSLWRRPPRAPSSGTTFSARPPGQRRGPTRRLDFWISRCIPQSHGALSFLLLRHSNSLVVHENLRCARCASLHSTTCMYVCLGVLQLEATTYHIGLFDPFLVTSEQLKALIDSSE